METARGVGPQGPQGPQVRARESRAQGPSGAPGAPCPKGPWAPLGPLGPLTRKRGPRAPLGPLGPLTRKKGPRASPKKYELGFKAPYKKAVPGLLWAPCPAPRPPTGCYTPLGRFNSCLEGTRVLLQRLALVKENLGILWTFL